MKRGPPHMWLRAIVTMIVLWAGAPAWGQSSDPTLEIPEQSQTNDPVSGNLTGVFGGMLVGAEIVLFSEAMLRLKSPWAYTVGGILGAGAGAVGGYYVEKHSRGGAISLLVGGMVLAVPTMLAVAWGRAFRFDDDPTLELIRVEELEFGLADPSEGSRRFSARADERRQTARNDLFGPLLRYDSHRGATWQIPTPELSMRPVSREEWVMGFRPLLEMQVPVFAIDL